MVVPLNLSLILDTRVVTLLNSHVMTVSRPASRSALSHHRHHRHHSLPLTDGNIIQLKIRSATFDTLDLRPLSKLQHFETFKQSITTLHLDHMTALTTLVVSQEATLAAVNVTGCEALEEIRFSRSSQIRTLTGATELASLKIMHFDSSTRLSPVTVGPLNTALTALVFDHAFGIADLNVTGAPALKNLHINNADSLRSENLHGLSTLSTLTNLRMTYSSKLGPLDCTGLESLETLHIEENTLMTVSRCQLPVRRRPVLTQRATVGQCHRADVSHESDNRQPIHQLARVG